jgi:hypothetical protein
LKGFQRDSGVSLRRLRFLDRLLQANKQPANAHGTTSSRVYDSRSDELCLCSRRISPLKFISCHRREELERQAFGANNLAVKKKLELKLCSLHDSQRRPICDKKIKKELAALEFQDFFSFSRLLSQNFASSKSIWRNIVCVKSPRLFDKQELRLHICSPQFSELFCLLVINFLGIASTFYRLSQEEKYEKQKIISYRFLKSDSSSLSTSATTFAVHVILVTILPPSKEVITQFKEDLNGVSVDRGFDSSCLMWPWQTRSRKDEFEINTAYVLIEQCTLISLSRDLLKMDSLRAAAFNCSTIIFVAHSSSARRS